MHVVITFPIASISILILLHDQKKDKEIFHKDKEIFWSVFAPSRRFEKSLPRPSWL